jgi:hypothetical protein
MLSKLFNWFKPKVEEDIPATVWIEPSAKAYEMQTAKPLVEEKDEKEEPLVGSLQWRLQQAQKNG